MCFFFNDTATTEIYTLSLHDALPIFRRTQGGQDPRNTVKVEELMRPPTFVPESKPVDELLRDMQAQRIHIAIVVDEYGGLGRLVTIQGILEEMVGGEAREHQAFPRPPGEGTLAGAVAGAARK